MAKRIGILTAGGDCPGLNAAIRGVAKTAMMRYGMEVIGFNQGYRGLINGDYQTLTEDSVSNILTLGGTILGTSREKPFKNRELGEQDKVEKLKSRYKELDLDCLVCLGGNGTMKTAYKLTKEGLNVIGLPKTIDNDVYGTDVTFGFDSAVTIATDAIDRLHTTASSHNRVMVIEVMGHDAGWIALHSGVAGGGDVILIPEIPYSIDKIIQHLKDRFENGKKSAIVVVGEGIDRPENLSAAKYIADSIESLSGIETRQTRLGYVQRGGSPTAFDRVLATQYGAFAAELIADGAYNNMVALCDNKLTAVPLSKVKSKLSLVTADHHLVDKAKGVGVCFGD